MAEMPELIFKWDDADYRCRVTHDVIMHIENKVTLGELAQRVLTASIEGNHLPSSHISWIAYCLLKGAGAPVTSEMVWEKMKTGEQQEMGVNVVNFLMAEVYGIAPERDEDLEEAAEEDEDEAKKK